MAATTPDAVIGTTTGTGTAVRGTIAAIAVSGRRATRVATMVASAMPVVAATPVVAAAGIITEVSTATSAARIAWRDGMAGIAMADTTGTRGLTTALRAVRSAQASAATRTGTAFTGIMPASAADMAAE